MFIGIIVIMDIEWFFNFQTNVQKSSWKLTNKLNINIHELIFNKFHKF